jgi:hypothetical protein
VAVKTIELKDFSKELAKYAEERKEDLKRATINAALRSVPRLVAKSPVDTGLYAQSWDTQIDEESATVGNYAPHAPIIEYGARPFTPPIAPLLAWAKRVLQDPSQPPEYSSEVWALAKGTQAKIALKGIEPHHIMENEIPLIMEDLLTEMRRDG